jgi:glycosyltransferase involved in cell wall biosynthesis
MLRLVVVANTPPPYRVPVFQRLGRVPGVKFQAIFCSKREPNRAWDLPPFEFDHVFLPENYIAVKKWAYHAGERYIHNNVGVIASLRHFNPDIVVTDGFNPTHLYAFGYAAAKGLIHIPMTDGTDISEQTLTRVHRMVRRFVYTRSATFVSASRGGDRLYRSYGIPQDRLFQSCLCIDNAAFAPTQEPEQKKYDFIFCGRMEEKKRPLFALEVASQVAQRIHRKTRILFAGSGPLDAAAREEASRLSDYVEATFHGFASQQELPGLYRSARMFLFPTEADVWGVVANEACAAGLPVIVSPHAGVAGELVLDGQNGFICNLDAKLWADRAILLLMQPDLCRSFSQRSLALVATYTFDNAATGLLDACRTAVEMREESGVKMKGRL